MAPPGPTLVKSRPGRSTHQFRCRLDWTGAVHGGTVSYGAFVREHRLDFAGRPPLMASAAPAFRGDGARLNPEELLLASLASCHFMSYAAQCAWNGVELVGYSDEAFLTLKPVNGVMQVVEAQLRPRAVVASPDQVSRALGLHVLAHAGCFIARSVSFPVQVDPRCAAAGELESETTHPEPVPDEADGEDAVEPVRSEDDR